jgi:hypothetical protein
MNKIADALDGLSARDLVALQDQIAKRLKACAACGGDGAINVGGQAKIRGNSVRFALPLCPKCVEAHRLPESKAEG